VTGSDVRPHAAECLLARGVQTFAGHAGANVPANAKLLVYSAAVPEENAERLAAQQRGIPTYSYAQMLGLLAAELHAVGGQLLAVAGTHGKSTVTAMTAEILIHAGLDPTVVCGAASVGGGVPSAQKNLPAATNTTPRNRRLCETGGRSGEGNILLLEAC